MAVSKGGGTGRKTTRRSATTRVRPSGPKSGGRKATGGARTRVTAQGMVAGAHAGAYKSVRNAPRGRGVVQPVGDAIGRAASNVGTNFGTGLRNALGNSNPVNKLYTDISNNIRRATGGK